MARRTQGVEVSAPAVVVVSPYRDEHGPARTLEHAARAVALAGYRPVCVVHPETTLTPGLEELGARVRHVTHLRTVPRALRPPTLARFAFDHLVSVVQIARIARAERAVLVYSISEAILAGGIAARLLRVPSLTHVIGMSIASPPWLARTYIPVLRRLSTCFVASSSAVARLLLARGVPAHAVAVVHNGVPIGAVDESSRRPPPRPPDGRPHVGMVAAYDPRKGHDLFVEAAARIRVRHPEARFSIVGGALAGSPESVAFEQEVRRLIASRGLARHVEQVGQVDGPDVYRWLRSMDVVVVPSRTEAFAHSLAEAMACGRPVVATRLEGNLDALVDGESGLLTSAEPEALADAVSALLDDPERAGLLGRAAAQRARRRFDEALSLPELAGVVARVAGRPNGRPRGRRR